MKPEVCAIIDPFVSGGLLASEFRRRGYQVVNVHSGAPVSDVDARDFDHSLYLDSVTPEQLVERYTPLCVLPSRDSAVEVADALCEKLGLLRNSSRLSSARRDKFEMGATVAAAGLQTSLQIRSKSVSEVCEWAQAHNHWPVVIKPVKSHGSDNVFKCRTPDEVEVAMTAITGKDALPGQEPHLALAQTCLCGVEYQANTVSYKGQHHVVNVIRYEKANKFGVPFLFHSVEYMPAEGEVQAQITEFALKVLAALAIENGPARVEVILTATGPAFIEMGARMAGGKAALTSRLAHGVSFVEVTADAYVNPEHFLSYRGKPYPFLRHVFAEYVSSPRDGTTLNERALRDIEALPSFSWFNFGKLARDAVFPKTVDMATSPFSCILANEDRAQVLADRRAFHDIEDTYLFSGL